MTPNSPPAMGWFFMHDMQKIAVDVIFTHMVAKKGIKNNGEISVESMCEECTQLKDVKVMGSLDSDILTRTQNKVALRGILKKN